MDKINTDFLKRYSDKFKLPIGLHSTNRYNRLKRIKTRLSPKFRELAKLLEEYCFDEEYYFVYPLYYGNNKFHWVDIYFPNKLAVIITNEFEYVMRRAGSTNPKLNNLKEFECLEVIDWDTPKEVIEKICVKLDDIQGVD